LIIYIGIHSNVTTSKSNDNANPFRRRSKYREKKTNCLFEFYSSLYRFVDEAMGKQSKLVILSLKNETIEFELKYEKDKIYLDSTSSFVSNSATKFDCS